MRISAFDLQTTLGLRQLETEIQKGTAFHAIKSETLPTYLPRTPALTAPAVMTAMIC